MGRQAVTLPATQTLTGSLSGAVTGDDRFASRPHTIPRTGCQCRAQLPETAFNDLRYVERTPDALQPFDAAMQDLWLEMLQR